MRGADLLVKSLVQAGVSRIFSLSGNQIMPVYDACFEAGIEIIHTRHEAAAVYMAEAYAQLTGNVGVALVTAGAGAANAVGPLFTANESETPVLLLTGDSPVAHDGMGAFQEMAQVPMLAPLTKLSVRPQIGADLGREVARAFRVAQSGRPGPVHIALAHDVVEQDASHGILPDRASFARDPMYPGTEMLNEIESAISAAARPVLICGPVMNKTRFDGLDALANTLGVPVIPMESPRGLKDPSLGNITKVMRQADLIVNLGKRVDFTLGFGKTGVFAEDARWINVQASQHERDRAHRNLAGRLVLSVAADPRDTARLLVERSGVPETNGNWYTDVSALLTARAYPDLDEERITSEQLCQAVQAQIAKRPGTVAICDGGEFGQWAQAVTHAETRVVNGISGAIGGGLCYGFAAGLARPDSVVFSLMGDGTVGFHFAEFETAARHGIPCVVVIGNDRRWNAEHQIQMRDYGSDRLIGCQLSPARYDISAQAFGAHGEYVTKLEELDDALDRAVASGKPACVNVIIDGTPAPAGPSH